MNDSRRVDVFHSSEYLINKELYMLVGKFLRFNDVIQICSHQMRNQINITEIR